jgi:hypothetical protein
VYCPSPVVGGGFSHVKKKMPNQKINLTAAEREEYDRAMQRLAILAEASTRDPLPEDFKKRSKSLSINELRAAPRPRPVTN